MEQTQDEDKILLRKEYGKQWKEKNIEKVREYARKWQKERRKKIGNVLQNKYKKIHPDRHAARERVRYQIKVGKIKKGKCEICGSIDVHAHHDDYKKPLVVRFLCIKHHWEYHKNYARKNTKANSSR